MIFKLFANIDIVLASQSPRRRELLRQTGLDFRVWAIPIDEQYPDWLLPDEIAGYLSKQKALAYSGKIKENTLIISADTVVIKNNQLINKPSNDQEAYNMLKSLSGTSHKVITGVSLTTTSQQFTFQDTTIVHFRSLTDKEINHYIKNYKPYDKAGAYGIQEWIGTVAVVKIKGSYHNVVGLPTARLIDELYKFAGVALPMAKSQLPGE